MPHGARVVVPLMCREFFGLSGRGQAAAGRGDRTGIRYLYDEVPALYRPP
jgi:hypothetical protein